MTAEELKLRGYQFNYRYMHNSNKFTCQVSFVAGSMRIEFGDMYTGATREEATAGAVEAAIGHFVEMRLAQKS